MILPNLFPLLKATSAVTNIIGTNPTRFYRHGSAPQDVEGPYVTQFVVDAVPENHLDGTPPVDGTRVQLSCWSDNAGSGSKGVETLAQAIRDAIEPHHHILSIRDGGLDPETMRYRIDLDVSVWNPR